MGNKQFSLLTLKLRARGRPMSSRKTSSLFLDLPRVKQFLAENHLPLGLRLVVLVKNLGHLAYQKYR